MGGRQKVVDTCFYKLDVMFLLLMNGIILFLNWKLFFMKNLLSNILFALFNLSFVENKKHLWVIYCGSETKHFSQKPELNKTLILYNFTQTYSLLQFSVVVSTFKYFCQSMFFAFDMNLYNVVCIHQKFSWLSLALILKKTLFLWKIVSISHSSCPATCVNQR